MAGKLDDFMRFHEAALTIRGQREQLLASNIANADTPNFKARDLDFNSAMAQALSNSSKANGVTTASGLLALPLKKTVETHLDALSNQNAADPNPLYSTTAQGNIDGNTVDMDVARNQFTQNSMHYEASLTMLNMQIKSMLAAIQG